MTRRQVRRQPSRRQNDEAHTLNDERIRPIRWGRIWTALVMIVAAIFWLAIDNHLGITTKPVNPTPAPLLTRQIPALGTPRTVQAATVNAKLIGHLSQVGGTHAPAGSSYLLLAVRIANHGKTALPVAPSDFHLALDGKTVATAHAYPGVAAPLFAAPLAGGSSAEGRITLLAPGGQGAALNYIPAGAASEHGVLWSIP